MNGWQFVGLFAGEDPTAWTGSVHLSKEAAVEAMYEDIAEHTYMWREDAFDGEEQSVQAFIHEHGFVYIGADQLLTHVEWNDGDSIYKWFVQTVGVET